MRPSKNTINPSSSFSFRIVTLAFALLCAVATLAFSTASASAAPGALRILVIEALCDPLVGPDALLTQLRAEPGVTTVDFTDGAVSIPEQSTLNSYDAVVAYGDCNWSDETLMGNRLADYQDQGGVAIGAAFDWQGTSSGYTLDGRWITDAYSPFPIGASSDHAAVTLGTFDAAHPLMAGISALDGYYVNDVSVNPGATVVAYWSSGKPAIAVKGRAVAINTFLGDSYGPAEPLSGPYGKLIVNATNAYGRKTVTAAKTGGGTGKVTSSSGGIDCGALCVSSLLGYGDSITLAAKAGKNSRFVGWTSTCSGTAPCVATATTNQVVTARFTSTKLVIGKARLNRSKGTAKLRLRARDAGKLVISGTGVKRVKKTYKKAAYATVTVRATGKQAGVLARTGKVKLKLKLKFTPTGAKSFTMTKYVTLKR